MGNKKDRLDATSMSLDEFFDGQHRKLTIPKFQRSYCWTDRNIKILWSDLISLVESNKQTVKFLGAVILSPIGKTGLNAPRFEVIDGQQRIVTLFHAAGHIGAKNVAKWQNWVLMFTLKTRKSE